MSPRAYTERGYWFGFYSNENNEPPHIHVKKAGNEAKYWLTPRVAQVYNYGFAPRETQWMERVIVAQLETFLEKWHEHFSQ